MASGLRPGKGGMLPSRLGRGGGACMKFLSLLFSFSFRVRCSFDGAKYNCECGCSGPRSSVGRRLRRERRQRRNGRRNELKEGGRRGGRQQGLSGTKASACWKRREGRKVGITDGVYNRKFVLTVVWGLRVTLITTWNMEYRSLTKRERWIRNSVGK